MQDFSQITEIVYANYQYPKLLREISSPPTRLYVRGRLVDMPLVAIVGSRKPTKYGELVTYQLASELAAAGIGIVSGLALGIDAVAHQAAVEVGGYTVAVMGCGLDEIYPKGNRELGRRILDSGGAIMGEYPSGMPPLKQNFPARNRIIAGLVLGVIVTEAAARSGSLITATLALDQRVVMAVPGNITSLLSAGPNNLIRAGARAVSGTTDVLEELNLVSSAVTSVQMPPRSREEAALLDLLASGTNTSKALIEASGLSASRFAQVISLMELSGRVRNLGAGVWMRR